MAGESFTLTQYPTHGRIRQLIAVWVADDTSAGTQTLDLTGSIEGQLLTITTVPSGSPTDDYDVTLLDENSIDMLQGVGNDRDTSNTEQAVITYSGTQIHPYVAYGQRAILTVANNSQTSATGSIRIVWAAAK